MGNFFSGGASRLIYPSGPRAADVSNSDSSSVRSLIFSCYGENRHAR